LRDKTRGLGNNGRVYPALLTSAALVLAADQATKELALSTLEDGPVDVIEGVLTFRLTFNSGGAFGIGGGFPGLFLAATLIVVVLIFVAVRHIDDRSWIVPLGMVLGGGLGNVVDRLFRNEGRVIDFVDLHVWPVFNLADTAIVVAVGLMLLTSARTPPEKEPSEKEPPEKEPA
jgi:signal peptidase II